MSTKYDAAIARALPLSAVIYEGVVPRFIGTAANVNNMTQTELRIRGDAALRDAGLCATYISRAVRQDDGTLFILCHG